MYLTTFRHLKIVFIMCLSILMIFTFRIEAQSLSAGCIDWSFAGPGLKNYVINTDTRVTRGTSMFIAGEILEVVFNLGTATDANVSLQQPSGVIVDGPYNLTTGMLTIQYTIPADGLYIFWVDNDISSNGTVIATTDCYNSPSVSQAINTDTTPVLCNFDDGRINYRDCDSSVVVYQDTDTLSLYAIHPLNSIGSLVLQVAKEEIVALGIPNENLLITTINHPFSNYSINIWRLSTGEMQLSTQLSNGKPYSFIWLLNNTSIYDRLK